MHAFSLARWSAWMPGRETQKAWQDWASQAVPAPDDSGDNATPPAAAAIPALLRRRADPMGRAALQSLTGDGMSYAGERLILCSRFGEFGRSLALQHELATEGRVSPQQFSMAVHNAIGGLFMMANKAHAPLTALAAARETARAGLEEALAQLAESPDPLWLVYAEEPLPADYQSLAEHPKTESAWFACALELIPGASFALIPEAGAQTDAQPLDLLRFFLSSQQSLSLSGRGGWMLCRC